MKLVRDAKRRRFDVVVLRLDRFRRNLKYLIVLLDEIAVARHCVREPWRRPFGDWGVGTIFADGFRVDDSGDIQSLDREELYDYM